MKKAHKTDDFSSGLCALSIENKTLLKSVNESVSIAIDDIGMI